MVIHDVSLDKIGHIQGQDSKWYADCVKLLVGDRHWSGYAIGFVPAGQQARKVYKGPLVPGPWAYAFACATVIDNYGGSKREREDAEAKGLVIRAELGDMLRIDGSVFKILPDHNNNIKLEIVQ